MLSSACSGAIIPIAVNNSFVALAMTHLVPFLLLFVFDLSFIYIPYCLLYLLNLFL